MGDGAGEPWGRVGSGRVRSATCWAGERAAGGTLTHQHDDTQPDPYTQPERVGDAQPQPVQQRHELGHGHAHGDQHPDPLAHAQRHLHSHGFADTEPDALKLHNPLRQRHSHHIPHAHALGHGQPVGHGQCDAQRHAIRVPDRHRVRHGHNHTLWEPHTQRVGHA